jgi:hypothetical protein
MEVGKLKEQNQQPSGLEEQPIPLFPPDDWDIGRSVVIEDNVTSVTGTIASNNSPSERFRSQLSSLQDAPATPP